MARTTVKALETHPLDVTQPTGTLLLSHGACAGDFELPEGAAIAPASMPAIGLVHTDSFPPAIRLVKKKTARRIPERRFCTNKEVMGVGFLWKAVFNKVISIRADEVRRIPRIVQGFPDETAGIHLPIRGRPDTYMFTFQSALRLSAVMQASSGLRSRRCCLGPLLPERDLRACRTWFPHFRVDSIQW